MEKTQKRRTKRCVVSAHQSETIRVDSEAYEALVKIRKENELASFGAAIRLLLRKCGESK